ncbi:hypothetical protein [Methylorubrum aminovorans]
MDWSKDESASMRIGNSHIRDFGPAVVRHLREISGPKKPASEFECCVLHHQDAGDSRQTAQTTALIRASNVRSGGEIFNPGQVFTSACFRDRVRSPAVL